MTWETLTFGRTMVPRRTFLRSLPCSLAWWCSLAFRGGLRLLPDQQQYMAWGLQPLPISIFDRATITSPQSVCPRRTTTTSRQIVTRAIQRRVALKARTSRPSAEISSSSVERDSCSAPSPPQSQQIVDADQIRRRHILLSILAGASGATWPRPAGAYADESSLFLLSDGTDLNRTTGKTVPDASMLLEYVIKPPLDDREYIAYTLENGLRVLLCSDPATNEAAAAVDVHVGATSDPSQVPGLAHFNEHCLFLGTRKYPQEGSFEGFLAANGGSSNAYTDSENTVYYFNMEAEANGRFAEGLLRFGSFFSEPLFTESATGRELNAIESENAKNLQSDSFRVFQMLKARANPEHPFSKFFTGNKKTLLDDTKAQGISLRQELIKFYNRYYSANQMTLAVVGPQPIEQLREMVANAFAEVPNRQVDKPEKAWAGIPPFDQSSIVPAFYHLVEVVPVQDLRQINIAWPILYTTDKEREAALLIKPRFYVAHLLGHEGPGSLLSYLKRRGWANSVAAASAEELSDFEVFELVVGLTTKGLGVINKIVEAVYSYLGMLRERNIPNYVLEEVLQLEELDWRFLTRGNAASYAQSLSTSMQLYPPPLYIAGPRRLALEDYVSTDNLLSSRPRSTMPRNQIETTRSEVEAFLSALKVENAMVTVLSKLYQGRTDRKEKWYGTDYHVSSIPVATLDRWRNPENWKRIGIDFPKPNQFIPSEAGLVVKRTPLEKYQANKRSFEARMEPITAPRVLPDGGTGGRWTVYFKQDDRFGKPQAYLVFEVLTNKVYDTPVKAALSNLYEICVSDRLTEYTYDAGLAGLLFEVKALPRGVRLTFGGYNDKLKQFALYISRKLSSGLREVLPENDSDFDRYKDQIMRALSAFDVKQPYAHASYYAQLTMQPRRFQYSNKELREATRTLTLPDLKEYANVLWSSGKGEALIQGNLEESEALELVRAIDGVLKVKPASADEYPPRLEALPLPTSGVDDIPLRLLVAEPNEANENSVAYVTLQSLGKSERDHVLLELLAAIVDEPFYNLLRTKKQLGYVVSSGIRGIGESRIFSFVVQSSVATSDELTVEILQFLDSLEETILNKIPPADVAVYVKSLIDRKTEPDKELAAEVTRNWAEISSGRLQFDRLQREAAALLEVEKADIIDFWRRIYAGDGRRVLITEVIPRQGKASQELPPATTRYKANDPLNDRPLLGIDDIEQFRHDRERLIYGF